MVQAEWNVPTNKAFIGPAREWAENGPIERFEAILLFPPGKPFAIFQNKSGWGLLCETVRSVHEAAVLTDVLRWRVDGDPGSGCNIAVIANVGKY